MRKKIAFYCIFIANIVLFVHAVIPHHHHGNVIVWHQHHSTEYIHHNENHHHLCPCAQDENNSSDDDTCLLNKPIPIPDNKIVLADNPVIDLMFLFELSNLYNSTHLLTQNFISRYPNIATRFYEEPLIFGSAANAPPTMC